MAINGRLILLHKPTGESGYIGVHYSEGGWAPYRDAQDSVDDVMNAAWGNGDSHPPTADDFELIYEKET